MVFELVAYRAFVKNLVLKDLKLKYRDSLLGFVWSLANPLMMIAVYTFAFKYVMRIGKENYAFFLMSGLLPWSFFAGALQASTASITGNANLIRTVYFPRETLPISTVLFAFVQLILALVVFLPALAFVSDVPLHATSLLFLPLLMLHLVMTMGLALALSALNAPFRDVTHFTEVGLLLLFWITPIAYPVAMASPGVQLFFKLSPTAAFAIAYQDVLIEGLVPETLVMLTVVGWSIGMLALGRLVFRRLSHTLAEEV